MFFHPPGKSRTLGKLYRAKQKGEGFPNEDGTGGFSGLVERRVRNSCILKRNRISGRKGLVKYADEILIIRWRIDRRKCHVFLPGTFFVMVLSRYFALY